MFKGSIPLLSADLGLQANSLGFKVRSSLAWWTRRGKEARKKIDSKNTEKREEIREDLHKGSLDKGSYEGRTEDALAPGGEEGRDKLRKTAGIGKYESIRRYPNGATHPEQSGYPG